MVLAWELIQGKIETLICIASTIIVVFALFKLRLSTNTDMILLFSLTHLPHARVYFYFYFFFKKTNVHFLPFQLNSTIMKKLRNILYNVFGYYMQFLSL